MWPLNTSSHPISDRSSVVQLCSSSILSLVVGGKCGGGRLVVQLIIPFIIIAMVIGGAVLLRRSQLRIVWRSDLGLSAPGFVVCNGGDAM